MMAAERKGAVMAGSVRRSHARLAAIAAGVAAMVLIGTAAVAKPASDVIVLPGASSAEGITDGHGSTFYAGDLFAGDIYRGDIQKGTAELFIDAPDGRQATGMNFDDTTGLLYVAGAFTGQAYVYDTNTGSTVASYQFADPTTGPVINDVALTKEGAWFTNSTAPVLYFVPFDGEPGAFETLSLSGPASDTSGDFNNNGIVATPDGGTLIVAHSGNGELYTVDPSSGESALIEGVSVPNVDGIILRGRKLWAVQNFSNQISAVRLSPDLSSGSVDHVITSSHFEVPATAALFGSRLGVTNTKFDTGFPPTAEEYEVVIVRN
jgi:sugar lactone lactonase YvrE